MVPLSCVSEDNLSRNDAVLGPRTSPVVAPNAFGDGAGPESLRGQSLRDTERWAILPNLRRGGAPRALPATRASQLLHRPSFDFQLHRYGYGKTIFLQSTRDEFDQRNGDADQPKGPDGEKVSENGRKYFRACSSAPN